MFEVFNAQAIKEEVRLMLLALKDSDYAISDLEKEEIESHAKAFGIGVKVRKLKSGKFKVTLKKELE